MRLPEDQEKKFIIEKRLQELTFDNMVKYLRATIVNFPLAISGTAELSIMNDHWMIVSAQVNIHLDHGGVHRQGQLKCA